MGEPRETDDTACPDGVALTPFNVTYFDLCFVEEFHRLRKGLKAMRRDMRPRPGALSPRADLDDWFSQTEQRVGGWYWRNLGNYDLTARKNAPAFASDASVQISHFLPSAISIQICVSPTDEFKNRFQHLISRNAQRRPTINHFSLWRRGWSISLPTTDMIRQEEIEDLFLELNKQVVRILREYLPCGWLRHGPLPSVEAFVLETGDRANNAPDHRRFWSSVAMSQLPIFSYTREEFTIFPPQNALHRQIPQPHRILVNEPLMAENGDLAQHGHRWNAIQLRLIDICYVLCPLLAIQEHVSNVAKEVSALRNRLSPALSRSRWFFRRVFVFRVGFRWMERLNSLVFSHRRIEAELDVDNVKALVGRELIGFKQEAHGKTDSVELLDSMLWRIEMVTKHIAVQVGVLKDSYRDLMSFRIQRTLFCIALIGIVIAFLQFDPNAKQISTLENMWDFAKGLFYVTKNWLGL